MFTLSQQTNNTAMTTPKQSEIEKRARELWFQDRLRREGSQALTINPEVEELREEGFLMLAQHELMRDTDQYEEYLAKEIGQNIEDLREKPKRFDFDLNEALLSGCFIAGGKQCGKTNLAKNLADLFMKHGHIVKAFDLSQQWLDSSIPYSIEVNQPYLEIPLYRSVVFDLSRLYASQIKTFITQILAKEFSLQVAMPKHERKWVVYFFEECQVLIPSGKLRSKESQEVLRLLTSGANYNLSYVAITQRPSTVDTTVMELTFQKYFARLDGENDKRKIKTYIESYADMLDSLKLGEFIYDKGNETKKVATELFASTTKPRRLQQPSLTIQQPQPQQPQQPNLTVGYLIIALAFVGLFYLISLVI